MSKANTKAAEKTATKTQTETMTGAEIVLRALKDQGVDRVFGYPGGAILPIYDALYQQDHVLHVLARHEQGATHAAEGYARSSNKVGTVFVTSGPGATNAVTGLADALLDSIPMVVICGQVPSHLIGTDAFQEADVTGITRSCTKHNYLVKDPNDLARVIHEAYHIARTGRPGPVVIDIPKDVQFAMGDYIPPQEVNRPSYQPAYHGDVEKIREAVELLSTAKKPVFYTGGGVINAGPKASELLYKMVKASNAPITNTLMGLGAYPASDENFLGMLGMHGTYEANLAMYHCDVMVCVGARFDDRVTGALDEFSPHSKKIHIDVDPSSINKIVPVEVGIVGDASAVLEEMLSQWKAGSFSEKLNKTALNTWWKKIETWRARDCLSFKQEGEIIKPQHAIKRLYEKTEERDQEIFITTEVGQHQMWAAQHFYFDKPNRWMTSGGLGTMGYGLPAALGAQVANPDGLVIDIAGDASIQMCIQELATAVQYNLPVKVFILNNEWMGMVRQWQQLLHGERYSQTYSESLPDFEKLGEAFGILGLRANTVDELDGVIDQMLDYNGPVIVDVRVAKEENCFPMIPSGKAHYDMILNDQTEEEQPKITGDGLKLV